MARKLLVITILLANIGGIVTQGITLLNTIAIIFAIILFSMEYVKNED